MNFHWRTGENSSMRIYVVEEVGEVVVSIIPTRAIFIRKTIVIATGAGPTRVRSLRQML